MKMSKYGITVSVVCILILSIILSGCATVATEKVIGEITEKEAIAEKELLETIDELENKHNTDGDNFVSTIPENYPEDTLLRTTNDFVVKDNIHTFFQTTDPLLDEFKEDKIEFLTDSVELEEKWVWEIKSYDSSKGNHAIGVIGKIYPDLWSILSRGGTKFINPSTFKKVKNPELPDIIMADEKTRLFISFAEKSKSGGEKITLTDTKGHEYWSFTTSGYRNPRFHLVGDYFVDGRDNYGFAITDIIKKEPVARVFCTNDDTINYYNVNPIYSDTYFWTIWTDIMGTERKLYRINPETLEILSYDIEKPEKAFFIQDVLYIINKDRNKLFATKPKTGIIIQEFDLDDYFEGTTFTCLPASDHPFICENEEGEYIFNPIKPENSFKIDSFISNSNYRKVGWQGWNNYWSGDEESIFGLDTFTGEKTWVIKRTLLGVSPHVEIADNRGVLIAHGNKVSAFAPANSRIEKE